MLKAALWPRSMHYRDSMCCFFRLDEDLQVEVFDRLDLVDRCAIDAHASPLRTGTQRFQATCHTLRVCR